MRKRRFIQGLLILVLLCGAVLLAHPAAAWAAIEPAQPKQEDSVYQIRNAGELYWFAGLVNGTLTDVEQDLDACAVLTGDIIINKDVLNSDGTLNGTPTNVWTPIGRDEYNTYTGTFDGQGHTISGIYIDSNATFVGLFGYIGTDGNVLNLILADSYINSSNSSDHSIGFVGGICGYNEGSFITNCSNSGTVNGGKFTGGICGYNYGSITDCSNSGTVTGSGDVGGICGENEGSIINCSNSGTVTGSDNVGGICGIEANGSIINCSNSGSVSSSGAGELFVGGICGYNFGSIITNCYWLKTTDDGAGIGAGGAADEAVDKYVDQYASGEVAWLLNQWQGNGAVDGKVWAVGDDGYPVLNGKSNNIVVKLTFNANTGNVEDQPIIRYANAGAALPSVEPPAREGYIFADWNTKQDGSGSSFSAITPQTDTILYAQWIEVTLNQTNFTYNGQPLEPDPIVKIGDQMLTKDTDYTVAYDNNVNVGTATITVTGIGSYTGISGSITFTIAPATLTIASADVADKTYDGSTAATVNSVTFSGVTNSDTLQLGSDYTATAVFDSADAGERTATVTVTLTNTNYTLAEDATTCQATATIAKADYDGAVAASGTIQPGASGTVTLPALPEGASYGTPTTTDSAAVGSLSIAGDRLNYSGGSISDGAVYTVTVPVTGAMNFNDYTITVTLTGEIPSTPSTPSIPSTPSTPVTPEPSEPADSEETVTNPDGSTTTTITKEDGSTSTTTVSSDGKVEAEVTLSDEAIAESTESGDNAVALPVPEMTASSDRDTAPTVTVHLPENTTTSKVDIPVQNVTAGTVAILVHDDGSEEVLKNTVQTEAGISVAVSDGDTLKIVDNSKTFDDVANDYWGAAAIDFATSRELFAGTAENTFSPDSDMTRAMIWSVLARYEGADTTAAEGSAWYAGTQQWAIDNGISDGTNPNDPMTREQFAAMLYRSVGSPAVNGSVEDFGDAASVSSRASDAMIWAVQNGIIGGYEDSTLRPQNTATRTEVAAMLQRFVILNAQ